MWAESLEGVARYAASVHKEYFQNRFVVLLDGSAVNGPEQSGARRVALTARLNRLEPRERAV
jgi:hypothetical protein